MKKAKAVFVISLGCAKNMVDTEVMCGTLVTNGFYLAADPDDADICLINTCGFIRDAKDESLDQIEWAVSWKAEAKGRMIIVAGCLAQRESASVSKMYPEVDLIVGLDDVPRLPELITEHDKKGMRCSVKNELPVYLYDDTTPRILVSSEQFAYIKVAEGCDHRCSYCAIPLIRGNQRSRTPESVRKECLQLLNMGVKELNFVAQDTSRYGTDLKPAMNLEKLLRNCDELEGDFWIRVLYTHPLHLTEGLLDVLANSKHVVPYLDIPLQHISTHILRDMKRGMDGDRTRALIAGIREKYPSLAIRTTFLVGYPGETEADFEELMEFAREMKFDRMGAFAFSPEEGTAAALVKDGIVPEKVAEQRRNALMKQQAQISRELNKGVVGREMRVLLEEQHSTHRWIGRTLYDAPEVDNVVTVATTAKLDEGGFVNVRVTGSNKDGLVAVQI